MIRKDGWDAVCAIFATLTSMQKIKIENHTFSGGLWFGAWLFTIGFLKLTFWKGVLALILWPYYLGSSFSLPG